MAGAPTRPPPVLRAAPVDVGAGLKTARPSCSAIAGSPPVLCSMFFLVI
jgi:hypothetical protein